MGNKVSFIFNGEYSFKNAILLYLPILSFICESYMSFLLYKLASFVDMSLIKDFNSSSANLYNPLI